MMEFMGFPRPDGSVGVRNHVIILGIGLRGISIGNRVAGVVKGSVSVTSAEDDENSWLEVARHPNVAGMVVVGEGLDRDKTAAFVSNLERTGKPYHVVELRESDSIDAVWKTVRSTAEVIRDVSTQRRDLTRISKLLPAIFQARDGSLGEILKAFVRLLIEENGRCLWIGKEGEGRAKLDYSLRKSLTGDFSPGDLPGSDGGVYWYSGPQEDHVVWKSLLRCGAQLILHPVKGRQVSHPLMPAVNVAVGPLSRAEETFELDLIRLKNEDLDPQGTALLLLSETLATSSGKLTWDEVLEGKILPL